MSYMMIRLSAKTHIVRTAALLLLLLFASSLAFAQAGQKPVTLNAEVDKDTITIGDPITYTISVVYGNGYHIELMNPGTNLGEFEIRDFHKEGPVKLDDGRLKIVNVYVISVYDTGEFTIPPFSIAYWKREDEKDTLATKEIKIHVKSIRSEDAKDIQDIKDPIAVKPSFTKYIVAGAAGFILFAGLIAALIVLVRRRRRLKAEGPPPPRKVVPPHIIAVRELDGIEALDLPSQGRIKEYYIAVSEVIRKYIYGRYGVVTMERTTDEIMSDLLNRNVNREHSDPIGGLLRDADMVKFAKYRPGREMCADDMKRARTIIEITKETQAPDAIRV